MIATCKHGEANLCKRCIDDVLLQDHEAAADAVMYAQDRARTMGRLETEAEVKELRDAADALHDECASGTRYASVAALYRVEQALAKLDAARGRR